MRASARVHARNVLDRARAGQEQIRLQRPNARLETAKPTTPVADAAFQLRSDPHGSPSPLAGTSFRHAVTVERACRSGSRIAPARESWQEPHARVSSAALDAGSTLSPRVASDTVWFARRSPDARYNEKTLDVRSRPPEPRAARGGHAYRWAAADSSRGRQRKDARHCRPNSPSDSRKGRAARGYSRRHVHEQGGRRDARAGRAAARRQRSGGRRYAVDVPFVLRAGTAPSRGSACRIPRRLHTGLSNFRRGRSGRGRQGCHTVRRGGLGCLQAEGRAESDQQVQEQRERETVAGRPRHGRRAGAATLL